MLDIEQDGLFIVPAQVRNKKKQQPERLSIVFYGAKKTGHALGMSGLLTHIDLPGLKLLVNFRNSSRFFLLYFFVHALTPDCPNKPFGKNLNLKIAPPIDSGKLFIK